MAEQFPSISGIIEEALAGYRVRIGLEANVPVLEFQAL